MHLAEFLYALGLGVDVEVIVSLQPERLRGAQGQGPRHGLLQRLQGLRQRLVWRFAEQQMTCSGMTT